jgi:membrane-associated two-gene conflict system component 1 (EACC1)
VVALGPHALTAVGAAVRAWIVRRRGRRVALELDGDRIELSGATEDEMRRLVEAFVSRHERP